MYACVCVCACVYVYVQVFVREGRRALTKMAFHCSSFSAQRLSGRRATRGMWPRAARRSGHRNHTRPPSPVLHLRWNRQSTIAPRVQTVIDSRAPGGNRQGTIAPTRVQRVIESHRHGSARPTEGPSKKLVKIETHRATMREAWCPPFGCPGGAWEIRKPQGPRSIAAIP